MRHRHCLVWLYIALLAGAHAQGCPATGAWKLDVGDMVCANIRGSCQTLDTVYQELYTFDGTDTYCCRCTSTTPRAADTRACPSGFISCDDMPPGSCHRPLEGQFSEAFKPEHCCACSAAGSDPASVASPSPAPAPVPAPTLTPGRASGTFSDPIPVSRGDTTDWLSLASGHLLLDPAATSACGYTASQFKTHQKLVLRYDELGGTGQQTTFAMCNSGDFVQNFWLMDCPTQLSDAAGADADAAGCTCQLADDGYYVCPTGRHGFQGTTTTQPGHSYYVIVQANPPDTGADASKSFKVSVSGEPASVATAQLKDGAWPLNVEQAECVQREAADSDAFARYVYLSALTGAALLFGVGSPELEALRTIPGAEQLGALPVHQVVQDYNAWAEATLSGCGAPTAFAYGDDPSTSPLAFINWWASVDESLVPGLGEGESEGISGRRLLGLLDDALGGARKQLLATTIGVGAGFLGGLAGAAAQKGLIVLCTAAGTAVGGPIGAAVGMMAGVAVGTAVATVIGAASKAAGKALAEQVAGSEASVQAAFALGNEAGSMISYVRDFGITKLAGKAVPQIGGKITALLDDAAQAFGWMERVKKRSSFLQSIPLRLPEEAAQIAQQRGGLSFLARELDRTAKQKVGEAVGTLLAPFAVTGSKFVPKPWGTGEVLDDVQAIFDSLAAEELSPPPPPPPPVAGAADASGSAADARGGGSDASGDTADADAGTGGGAASGCQACSKDEDCEEFFVTVCKSCGRVGARCTSEAESACCDCPRCMTTGP